MSGYWRTYIIQEPYNYSVTVDGVSVEKTGVRRSERREWVDTPDEYPPEPEPPHRFDSFEAADSAFPGELGSARLMSDEILEWTDTNADNVIQDDELEAVYAVDSSSGTEVLVPLANGDTELDRERIESAIALAAVQAVEVPPGADASAAEALFTAAEERALADFEAYRAEFEAEGLDADEALERAAVLTRADILSERAMNGEVNFTRNDYLLMYEAAEIRTGVPAEVLKAMGVGESGAGLFEDGMSRQYVLLDEMLLANATGRACTMLTPGTDGNVKVFIRGDELVLSQSPERDLELIEEGFEVYPVTIGLDISKSGVIGTIGIGIHQITLPPDDVAAALEGDGIVQWHGGDSHHPGIEVDVRRAILDPVYNIQMAGELLQWGRTFANFSDGLVPPDGVSGEDFYPDNPGNPLPGDWGYIVAVAQGTTADAVTRQRVIDALTNPNYDPTWMNADPNLYSVGSQIVPYPDNQEACAARE